MYDWSSKRSARTPINGMFQLLLKGCTIEALKVPPYKKMARVSVVVERMYDWSRNGNACILKNPFVSVVVERMYDWSRYVGQRPIISGMFQLLLKGCTIEATLWLPLLGLSTWFQLLLKGCTIEAYSIVPVITVRSSFSCCWKDVRLKL